MGLAPDAPDWGSAGATAKFGGAIAAGSFADLLVQGLETCFVQLFIGNGLPTVLVNVSPDGVLFTNVGCYQVGPSAPQYVSPARTVTTPAELVIPCAGLQKVRLSVSGTGSLSYAAAAGPGSWLPAIFNQVLPAGGSLVKVSLTLAAGADGVILAGVAGQTITGYKGRLTVSAAQAGSIFSLADVTAHTDLDLFDLVSVGPFPLDYGGAPLAAAGNSVGLHNYAGAPLIVHGSLILVQV